LNKAGIPFGLREKCFWPSEKWIWAFEKFTHYIMSILLSIRLLKNGFGFKFLCKNYLLFTTIFTQQSKIDNGLNAKG